MPPPVRRRLSLQTQIYVLGVLSLGALVLALSAVDIAGHPLSWQFDWLKLAGLTLVSGWLSVKLPSGRATISISETFVLSGTVLLGPGVGAILVALDALVLCVKEALLGRGLRWQQVAFNIAAPSVSIWFGATIAGITQVGLTEGLTVDFVVRLAGFTALYFLLNSWLVTFAIALEQRERPTSIWWANFRELWINFAAGASIAAFAANAKSVDLAFIGVIVPLLVVIYFTYSWSSRRVEAEREKNQQLNRVFLSTVEALALAIDAKDQVTHGHIRRVQRYAMALADALGVKDEKQLDAIRAAALLHDTGKLAVPEYILNKPGPLTAAEFERMKVHADVGADILKSIDFPYPVEPIVRHHHEAWNGSGYPTGLKGQQIPLGARILSVVDCYDALTSDRPYRPRMTRHRAEEELRERRGKLYDPWVVDAFLAILDKLEEQEAAERRSDRVASDGSTGVQTPQLDVITAATAEDREFNELRRDLPRTTSLSETCDVLFRYLRRVMPAMLLAVYRPRVESNELVVTAASGTGSAELIGRTVPVSERVSGWAFAHGQAVLNSDATLELGPAARSFAVPVRYVSAIPITDRGAIGVLVVFSLEPLERDHRRLLENSASELVASLPHPLSSMPARTPARPRAVGPSHEEGSRPGLVH
jgi:putative nucleotidyltransferase with HDIG domain